MNNALDEWLSTTKLQEETAIGGVEPDGTAREIDKQVLNESHLVWKPDGTVQVYFLDSGSQTR